MREPLTGPQRLALKATAVRWKRHRRPADARLLADAFGALMAERDQLAEQTEERVHQAFADADEHGVRLDACTAAELTAFVMHAIRGPDGEEASDAG